MWRFILRSSPATVISSGVEKPAALVAREKQVPRLRFAIRKTDGEPSLGITVPMFRETSVGGANHRGH